MIDEKFYKSQEMKTVIKDLTNFNIPGGADYILPAKRNHPDDFGVPHQPVWSAQSGDLDAGQGAGLEICHSGQSVWVKYGAHIEDKDLGVYMELVLFLSCYIYA